MNRVNAITLLLTIVIVGVVVVYSQRRPLVGGPGGVRTFTSSAPLGGASKLDAEIRMGAGVLRLRTIDTGNAYEAEITRNEGWPVDVSYRDGRLRIGDRGPRFAGTTYTNEWTVGVSRRVPLDLEVTTGVGRATLDLTGMSGSAEIRAGAGDLRVEFGAGRGTVERLELRGGVGRFEALRLGNAGAARIEARSGVGEFILDFSGTPRGTTELEVHGGVGRVLLTVPSGLGVRVRASKGLTKSLRLEGFKRVGDDEYVNDTWATATAKLDVRASLGIGEFAVLVK